MSDPVENEGRKRQRKASDSVMRKRKRFRGCREDGRKGNRAPSSDGRGRTTWLKSMKGKRSQKKKGEEAGGASVSSRRRKSREEKEDELRGKVERSKTDEEKTERKKAEKKK